MIRRAIAAIVLVVGLSTGLMIGAAPHADAGELCIRLLPTLMKSQLCLPTNP